MTKLELIEALATNGNNIENQGLAKFGIRTIEYFGQETELICGEIKPETPLWYCYDEPLYTASCDCEPADAIVKYEDLVIYLYYLED